MGSAGGSEEYTVLRTEQIYRIQAIQTLVGVIIAGFFTSGVVILSWSFSSGAVQTDVLFWATPILLGMVLTATAVAIRWHRILYRIGSYLVVFHEQPDAAHVPKDLQLGWLTRIRAPGMRRNVIDELLHSEGVVGPLALLLVLSCAPLGYAVAIELCRPWPTSHRAALWLSVVEAIATLIVLIQLHRVSRARQEFLEFWKTVQKREQDSRQEAG